MELSVGIVSWESLWGFVSGKTVIVTINQSKSLSFLGVDVDGPVAEMLTKNTGIDPTSSVCPGGISPSL